MTYSPMSGMNTRMLPVMTPGQGDRQRDLAEGRPAAGAEVLGRLEQGPIEPFEGDVEREDHQRQVVVDDPDEHRGGRAQDLDVPTE